MRRGGAAAASVARRRRTEAEEEENKKKRQERHRHRLQVAIDGNQAASESAPGSPIGNAESSDQAAPSS